MSTHKYNILVEQFNLATLPKQKWVHNAHLIVALWHIKHFGFTDALCQFRSKIILLNKFHGTENNNLSGYHETLTVFWARVIEDYVKKNTGAFEETVVHFLNSPSASREFPFEFYKREELLSAEYRAYYHEPTLKEFKDGFLNV